MRFTEDGACLPSWLGATDAYSQGGVAAILNSQNTTLKTGYVVGIHYPLDKGYEEATEIVYDVVARSSVGMDASTSHLYTNVRLGARLGGTENDFASLTLRSVKSYDHSKGLSELQKQECSVVLIECENGMSQNAIIVGFGRHPKLVAASQQLGHNYIFNFNGISTTISKDGEYAITFTGGILDANSNTYLKPPEATTGTFLKFLKDGSWTVDDAKGESIKLDKPGKALNAVARAINVTTTEKDYNLKTKGKVVIQATGNAVFNSGKKIYIGKEGATDPLVLGNKLAEAMKQLVTILSIPVIGQAGPFPCVSAFAAPLSAWGQLYGAKNISPFLSKKGYVE
jgi:hypothetical protein